ncbi:antitoxin Xre/MbcA/ParS toxin-binding domain-containing protein [Salinisphaera sp. SWV1]|uniref:antitoxin Xre/MbcA/ParS toxin-binding domain-containing protein n=1 Tax=Salinisphaera sp. SWV1 TaxID=3454139 RepID=UPI003F82C988
MIEQAQKALQNREKALRWLRTEKRSLDGQTPLDHAQRESGFLNVLAHLERIEHGIWP